LSETNTSKSPTTVLFRITLTQRITLYELQLTVRIYKRGITLIFRFSKNLFTFSHIVNTVDRHAKIFVRRSVTVHIPLLRVRTLSNSKLSRQKLTLACFSHGQDTKSEQKHTRHIFRLHIHPSINYVRTQGYCRSDTLFHHSTCYSSP